MRPDTDLPSYKQPPINEVVCGVQFEALTSFSTVHFGKLWLRMREEYPKTEDREPLAEIYERETGSQIKEAMLAFTVPPLRRVFYVDESGNYLLQVQPTRFLSNWRKQRDEDAYPRFSAARLRFLQGWKQFVAFLQDESLGPPKANQYELTYINHIYEATAPFPEGIQEHLGFFTWKNARTLKFLPTPRSANFNLQYALPNGKGALHVTIKHGKRISDQKGVMLLDLTARGPARPDWSDMEDWFDLTHEWIVKGFTDLTTVDAHARWRRER